MVKILTENRLWGRYITWEQIESILLDYLHWKSPYQGRSVEGRPIPLYIVGTGGKKILLWSQMHGNESTTTKAVFDLLAHHKENPKLLERYTLYIIPMLNPDGAFAYTRENASGVDLNRDAQQLSQPESQFLRFVFNWVKPDVCLNLHGQRSIFSAGEGEHPAVLSFLAPAVNEQKEITLVRQKAMEIISAVSQKLQKYIPKGVGRYSDDFNIHCTGDTFMSMGVPTILFEAGHYGVDYHREYSRRCMAYALFETLKYIAEHSVDGSSYESYFHIPANEKRFRDVLIPLGQNKGIALIFVEKISSKGELLLLPQITEVGDIQGLYSHITLSLSDIFYDNFIDTPKSRECIEQGVKLWVKKFLKIG